MDYLDGNPYAIRLVAGRVGQLVDKLGTLADLLEGAKAHARAAGDNAATSKLIAVLDHHLATAREGITKADAVRVALEDLANSLESADAAAGRAIRQQAAIPTLYGGSMNRAYLWEADNARADAAAVLVRSLPSGTKSRFIEYDGFGTTMKHIWNGLIVEPIEGLIAFAKFNYDLSPVRAVLDHKGWEQSWQNLASTTSTLWQAVVNDTFPDGTHGARQAVMDALSEIPNQLIDKDLMEKDPVAWMAIYGATVAGMLVGAGEAKIGGKVLATLRKSTVGAEDLAKLGALAGVDARAARVTSMTSKVLDDFPGLMSRVEYPVNNNHSGMWLQTSINDFRARLKAEQITLDLLKADSPGMTELKPGHAVVDLMDLTDGGSGRIVSVKSIDPSFGGYATNPSSVGTTLFNDAEKLRNWATPGTPKGTGTTTLTDPSFGFPGNDSNTVFILDHDYLTRDLYVALPDNGLTAAHAQALQNALDRIEQMNNQTGITINVKFIEVPR